MSSIPAEYKMGSNHISFTIIPGASVWLLSTDTVFFYSSLLNAKYSSFCRTWYLELFLNTKQKSWQIFSCELLKSKLESWNTDPGSGMIILWPCKMIMLENLPSKLLQFTIWNIWLWRDMKLDSNSEQKLQPCEKFAPLTPCQRNWSFVMIVISTCISVIGHLLV